MLSISSDQCGYRIKNEWLYLSESQGRSERNRQETGRESELYLREW